MRWLKVGAVIVVSVCITALGIDAADTLQGSRSTLLGQLIATESAGVCPEGMIEVPVAQTFTCIDRYEATAGKDCPHQNPSNAIQSMENINDPDCGATSVEEATPWRFITRDQAVTACLRSGKRLINSVEWYLIAGGTPDSGVCNTNSNGIKQTGSSPECVSAVGAYDTIGNVWEWTADDVINGQYRGREVPQEGYVAQVDAGGFPTVTNDNPVGVFFEDYFWTNPEGAYAVMRGGFYGSKSDAGLYSTHAATLPTASVGAIGFRCVI